MLVNLSSPGNERTQYLKVKIVLEVPDQTLVEQIQPLMPRVMDAFQTYLRELRPTDLEGSAGLYRLKEELTRRVNVAIAPTASTPCCSKKLSSSETGAITPMAESIRTHLAAEWGLALEPSRAPTPKGGMPDMDMGGGSRAPAPSGDDDMAAQWAAMIEDGGQFVQAAQGRRRAHPEPGGDRQPPRLQPRRHHAQREFRHPRDHQLGDGLLRASADARNRLRPAGPADDDIAAQFHLRQRRSVARPHHLGALRRLSQFDPAARDPGGVQGRGVGQFRPVHGQFEPDLFDHRRAARRTARADGDPHRGPALHDDRDQPGQAHDRGGAGRCRAGVPPALAGELQHRPARDQSALRRDLAAGQCGDPGAAAHRHGRSRRHDRAAVALRDDRADPRRAAADVHGREIRPRPDLGRPSGDRNRPGRDRRRSRAVRGGAAAAAADDARRRRHADARHQARRAGHGALRRRRADRRPHGPGRRPGRGARGQAAAQAEDHLRDVREWRINLPNRVEAQ